MPDQSSSDEDQDETVEVILDTPQHSPTAAVESDELDQADTTPSGQDSPIPHLDSAISLLERDLCKQNDNRTPSNSPSKRRQKKTIAPKYVDDGSSKPSCSRINTNIPDAKDPDSPSSASWSGSGPFHVIDRSYSPEPREDDDDPFFHIFAAASSHGDALCTSFAQHSHEDAFQDEQKNIGRSNPQLLAHTNIPIFVMSARVPDQPLPQGVLAGLGDWSLNSDSDEDYSPPPVEHPPDLDPANMQPDVPQDKYNREFGNALEETYVAHAALSMVVLPPGNPLSYHLRLAMARMPEGQRSVFVRRLWTLGLRSQYRTVTELGPLFYTVPPAESFGYQAHKVPASSHQVKQPIDYAVSSPSSSESSPVAWEPSSPRPRKARTISFGGVSAVSDRPPTKPRTIQFGGVTAVSERPPDPRKHAAAIAVSTSTSTALRKPPLGPLRGNDLDDLDFEDFSLFPTEDAPEPLDLISADISEIDASGNARLINQTRWQMQAEVEFLASRSAGKGKRKASWEDYDVGTGGGSSNDTMQQPLVTSTPDAGMAAIKGQGLEPPSSPKPTNAGLPTDDAEQGSVLNDKTNESCDSSEHRGWARSHSTASSSPTSSTTSSIRSSSSGSTSSGGKEKKLAYELDGTSQNWKPHSSKSGASVGLESDRAFNGGGFQALKDSLKMTQIAKPGESVSQAINRVKQLRVPPRPKPEDLARVKANRQPHLAEAAGLGRPIVRDFASEVSGVNEDVSPTNTEAPSLDAAFTQSGQKREMVPSQISPENMAAPSRRRGHRRNQSVALTGEETAELSTILSMPSAPAARQPVSAPHGGESAPALQDRKDSTDVQPSPVATAAGSATGMAAQTKGADENPGRLGEASTATAAPRARKAGPAKRVHFADPLDSAIPADASASADATAANAVMETADNLSGMGLTPRGSIPPAAALALLRRKGKEPATEGEEMADSATIQMWARNNQPWASKNHFVAAMLPRYPAPTTETESIAQNLETFQDHARFPTSDNHTYERQKDMDEMEKMVHRTPRQIERRRQEVDGSPTNATTTTFEAADTAGLGIFNLTTSAPRPLPALPNEEPFVEPSNDSGAESENDADNSNATLQTFNRPRADSDSSVRTAYRVSEELPESARRNIPNNEDSPDTEQDGGVSLSAFTQQPTSPPDDPQQ
ncbi:hypothetical protein PRZ48_002308 [Zasmidium cellare]|uniref:Uncharacterized protein n=1 Tax=Zasmidium cellare TaxID=395010 RepID=A0ABR0F3P0_ZASCE|nr:hypothetical protein PRZ48_002308 [Zasmidium cellare]